MRRHLLPRVEFGRWSGSALTYAPGGGAEMPPGLARRLRLVMGQSTRMPVHDEVQGFVICIQWLGFMVEIGTGRVR